jgi:hypothetical protein
VLHPFRRTFLIAALLGIAFVVLLATAGSGAPPSRWTC